MADKTTRELGRQQNRGPARRQFARAQTVEDTRRSPLSDGRSRIEVLSMP